MLNIYFSELALRIIEYLPERDGSKSSWRIRQSEKREEQ